MVKKNEKLTISYERSEDSNPKPTKPKKSKRKTTEPVAIGFDYSKPNRSIKK